ncbi:MAG: hypothetical protein ABFD69_03410 [Candidatus Sumerlaeia bacterium]
MNCPKCGNDLGFPEGGRIECRRCGWVRSDKAIRRRMLFGSELLGGRELGLHLFLSVAFMAAPYLVAVFLIPWLGARDPRYLWIVPPDAARWLARHYWRILAGYLAAAAIFSPEPDPDAPELNRNPIDEFLTVCAVLLLPGKWFLLSLYSLAFNRPDRQGE